jgi:hypothetical protein
MFGSNPLALSWSVSVPRLSSLGKTATSAFAFGRQLEMAPCRSEQLEPERAMSLPVRVARGGNGERDGRQHRHRQLE